MASTMSSDQKRIETATSKAQTKLKPHVLDVLACRQNGEMGRSAPRDDYMYVASPW